MTLSGLTARPSWTTRSSTLCAPGFGKVVFVIRKDIEEPFKRQIGSKFEKRVPVDYVFQEVGKLISGFTVPEGRTKPWGTTHAILMAANAIHEPFGVINADDFYGTGSFRVLAQHLQTGTSDYAMVGFVLSNTLSEFGTVARGVCHVTENGYLKDIAELKSIEREGALITNIDSEGQETVLNGNEIVSMNMWGFTPQIFGQLRDQFPAVPEAVWRRPRGRMLYSKHNQHPHTGTSGTREGAAFRRRMVWRNLSRGTIRAWCRIFQDWLRVVPILESCGNEQ